MSFITKPLNVLLLNSLMMILSIKVALYYVILVGLSIRGYNPSENIVSTKCFVVVSAVFQEVYVYVTTAQRNVYVTTAQRNVYVTTAQRNVYVTTAKRNVYVTTAQRNVYVTTAQRNIVLLLLTFFISNCFWSLKVSTLEPHVLYTQVTITFLAY